MTAQAYHAMENFDRSIQAKRRNLLSQRLGRCELLGLLQTLCHLCSPLWMPRYLFFKGRVFSSFLAFFKLFAMATPLCEFPAQRLIRESVSGVYLQTAGQCKGQDKRYASAVESCRWRYRLRKDSTRSTCQSVDL